MLKFTPPTPITSTNAQHFYGYYSICPWSKNGKYYVCLECQFQDHMPDLGESAKIMLLDLESGTHRYIAETKAWNFQQGSMIHWLPSAPNSKIIFNNCDGKKPISQILDIETGKIRNLPHAINAMCRTKDQAFFVSYSRLRINRKVVSYPCYDDNQGNSNEEVHPKEDGIFSMDLTSGEQKLVMSLDQIWKDNPLTAEMEEGEIEEIGISQLWFNHLSVNQDDTRIFFLARYTNWFRQLITSMWTMNLDGTEPYLLVDFHNKLSHFEWLTKDQIIVTMKFIKEAKLSHVILDDKKGNPRVLAPKDLIRNGHPTISPNGKLLATDTYSVDGWRYVYIVEMDTETVHEVAKFRNPKSVTGPLRCDPHPRWNHLGNELT
jgi:hypothetical protein